ncbi:hypothetical protein DFS34DRAFT_623775 [Phlyctochytrium arcticum]|nr:hypothetical protein DFS34DRAFT_623775 [Phlyctochytrium arcticum]
MSETLNLSDDGKSGRIRLSEENLRKHTKIAANQTPAPSQNAFSDRIKIWASHVSLASGGGDDDEKSPPSPERSRRKSLIPTPSNTTAEWQETEKQRSPKQSVTDLPSMLNELKFSKEAAEKTAASLRGSRASLAADPSSMLQVQPEPRMLRSGSNSGVYQGRASATYRGENNLAASGGGLGSSKPSRRGSTQDVHDSYLSTAATDTHNLAGFSSSPRMSKSKPRPTSNTSSQPRTGHKLICCLKIEIEKGVFQMLPVHEDDKPLTLAQSFCAKHGLKNWVESLEQHVSGAQEQYGKRERTPTASMGQPEQT